MAVAQRMSEAAYQEFVLSEVWSPSTGYYDVDAKLLVHRQRGDLEIWLVHLYERTLTSWKRQPDESYQASLHRDGTIPPVALPGVTIDLGALLDT